MPTIKKPLWEKRLSDIFWINNVAISPDGTHVVAATFVHDYKQRTGKYLPNVQAHFVLHLYEDAKTSPANPKWIDEFNGWDGVFGVAISGNKTVVAASGWLEKIGNTARGLLRAYDVTPNADGSPKILLDYRDSTQRISWVTLSDDGNVLATVADDVYVFIRDGKSFNAVPLRLGVSGIANRYCTGIALHPSGKWLAACDSSGHVYIATIDQGAITNTVTWTAPRELPFLSVAIAANAGTFVVGGGNFVFLFDVAAILSNPGSITPLALDTAQNEPAGTVPPDKPDGRAQENVRWVAISADGKLISVAANRQAAANKRAGVLLALSGADLSEAWRQPLDRNPNATSIDAAGTLVTVCDGFPTIKPAKFYLFDAQGQPQWEAETCSMNWPMFISADGTAIAAGSDDGTLYFFTP